MAEYVKLRVSAIKGGVILALAALIGGLPNRSDAATPAPAAVATPGFLASGGVKGSVNNSLLKLEKSFKKLDSALATVEHKLAKTYLTSQKIDRTFLKIKSADTSFLKIDDANASFLKIDDANASFLKIDDANASFLKIDDANSQFLKLGATAANANKFAGATPQSFSRSASGAVTIASGGPSQGLLSSPDGAISVSVSVPVGAGPEVVIANGTNQALPAVQDLGGTDASADIPAGSTRTIALGGSAAQLHVQFFPVPGLFFSATPEAATLVVSQEMTQTAHSFVGQLIAGSL